MANAGSSVYLRRSVSDAERQVFLKPDADRHSYSSVSDSARVRSDSKLNEPYDDDAGEHDGVLSINDETNDENLFDAEVGKTRFNVSKHMVTLRDKAGKELVRRKSYKLSYDPERDGGNEFKIDKVRSASKENDDLSINTERTFTKSTARSTASSTIFSSRQPKSNRVWTNDLAKKVHKKPTPGSRSTTNQSGQRGKEVNILKITQDPNKEVRPVPLTIHRDNDEGEQLLGETYTLDKPKVLLSPSTLPKSTPRLLTQSDKSEINIIFKNSLGIHNDFAKKGHLRPKNTSKTKGSGTRHSRQHLKPASPESVTERSHPPSGTSGRNSKTVIKEDSSSSLPPPNFKASLFKRIRTVSTARKQPRFSPVPIVTTKNSSDTPVKRKLKSPILYAKPKQSVKSENTFVKDGDSNRFERLKSSDSVRSHYDKDLRLNGARMSGKSDTANKENQDTAVNRYEDVDNDYETFVVKPKRHKRATEQATVIKVPLKSQSSNRAIFPNEHRNVKDTGSVKTLGIGSRVPKPLVHKRPVKNSLIIGVSNENSQHPTSESIFGQRTNTFQTANNTLDEANSDVFTESDKRAKLKQQQDITDGLKILKPKLKDTAFVAQHLDEDNRRLFLNKTRPGVPNYSTTRQSVKPVVKKVTVSKITKQTVNSETKRTLPLNSSQQPRDTKRVKTRIIISPNTRARKPKIESVSAVTLNSKVNDITWRVQPKIHRFDPNKLKNHRDKKGRHNNNTLPPDENRASSVATWVLNASHEPIYARNHTPDSVNTKSRVSFASKKRGRKRLSKFSDHFSAPDIDSKSTKSSGSNLINSGIYMPIQRRKLKRRPVRLKKRRNHLFTQVGKVKGYESEIPILYSDDDEPYPEPRPLTDSDRNHYPQWRRYEGDGMHTRVNYRDPAHKKIGRSTGALVRFFRNGDPDHKGIPLTVNRSFRNIETLLVYLNDKIQTPTGVKYIFKWPEGTEIKSVTEFHNRCVYVVASTRHLRRDVNYGESREGHWSNKKPSAGRLRKNELGLYQKPPSPKGSPLRNAPLIVTVINNLSRDKREKVILNPNTQQSFEEWLDDIGNPDMPVRALYSEKPPYTEIKSFSALFRELRVQSNFIACGDELLPAEVSKKRQAPSSNSSTDSINDNNNKNNRKKKPGKQQQQQEMGQIYEGGDRAVSPASTAMSRYDSGPRASMYPAPPGRSRPGDGRRTVRESVFIEIESVVREFIPPSYTDPEEDGAKPDKMLKSDWLYGFRGRDARHNLLVLPKTGELVYYVAAVVILYDKEKDAQRHYTKHNEEITCMSIHPNQYLIATGQMHGKDPEHASHIRIWHGVTLSTYSVIGLNVFYGGILSIGFSMDGNGGYMCVLDGSEKHVLSVWEWQSERIIARTTTSTEPVHCACFYPDGANNSILITYGHRHIYFWKIFYDVARKKEAKILRDRNSGIFEVKKQEDIPKSINCITFLSNGDVITGDTNGNLMIWDRDTSDAFTCRYAIQAHNGSIASLCLLEDGTLLSASGNEVKAWDSNSNFRAVKTRQIPQEAGNIRSIVTQTPGGIDGKLYVGTTNSAILDGSLQLKFRYLVQGHNDTVCGVVPHPFEPTFVSAGSDQVVYKWSLVNHKVIWRAHIEAPCTAVAIDHRHELVAVGTSEGSFVVLNSYNGMHIATIQVGAEPIGCLAFSPDGGMLALGCNDGLISIYAIVDRGQTYRKFNMSLRGHNSGVTELDWSSDGRSIQSAAADHELIFWDVDSMQQIKIPRMTRDVDWFTNTCHTAFAYLGPWTTMERGDVIKCSNRSSYRDLLITGDSRGRVRLYMGPSTKELPEYRSVRIYGSDVTNVAFTPDNRNALTCGGNDSTICQWSLVDDQ